MPQISGQLVHFHLCQRHQASIFALIPLHTTARVILWNYMTAHITALLQTSQWLPIIMREEVRIITTLGDLPSVPSSPHPLLPPDLFCLSLTYLLPTFQHSKCVCEGFFTCYFLCRNLSHIHTHLPFFPFRSLFKCHLSIVFFEEGKGSVMCSASRMLNKYLLNL